MALVKLANLWRWKRFHRAAQETLWGKGCTKPLLCSVLNPFLSGQWNYHNFRYLIFSVQSPSGWWVQMNLMMVLDFFPLKYPLLSWVLTSWSRTLVLPAQKVSLWVYKTQLWKTKAGNFTSIPLFSPLQPTSFHNKAPQNFDILTEQFWKGLPQIGETGLLNPNFQQDIKTSS